MVWCIPQRLPVAREHDLSREADMSQLRRRCPLGFHAHRDEVASSVLYPWGGGVFDLPEVGFPARAIVVCWGCPGRAMRDSSSGVERLRILRGRKSEFVVVPAFVVPVILTSLVSHGITSDFNLSVIEPSIGEVDHAVPEYTPSAFRGGSVRSLCAGGLCRGAGRRPSEASLTKTIRKSA
ncbi:hypothetical protein CDL15_Pgr020682 [Punica granatum]|uniref:Uncharacterized protein n=1 Tax=Punica granatum TaxID=22663 RepID=A0A218WVQ8_PUNGR|nr:hypothetical protein CDL15_Pgr020682 [Punica granatum]